MGHVNRGCTERDEPVLSRGSLREPAPAEAPLRLAPLGQLARRPEPGAAPIADMGEAHVATPLPDNNDRAGSSRRRVRARRAWLAQRVDRHRRRCAVRTAAGRTRVAPSAPRGGQGRPRRGTSDHRVARTSTRSTTASQCSACMEVPVIDPMRQQRPDPAAWMAKL